MSQPVIKYLKTIGQAKLDEMVSALGEHTSWLRKTGSIFGNKPKAAPLPRARSVERAC